MKITTEESRHQKGWFRALEIEGEKASWLNIYDYRMRVGGAVVRMGGIAGVATSHRHRMKGYSRTVMEDSTRFMRDEGLDCAVLYGIDNFYHKFGYAPCACEVYARVRTRDAEAVISQAGGFQVRALEDRDVKAMTALYNKSADGLTLSLVRDAVVPLRFRHGSEWRREAEVFAVEDARGRFAGYVVEDAFPAPTTVCEVNAATPLAYPSILDEIVRVAVERRDGEIVFRLPADDPFVHYLRRFGVTVETRYRNTGGPMGRIINQDAFLARIAEACWKGREGERKSSVEIETDLGRTRVAVPGSPPSRKSRLQMPQATLFQALVGFRPPRDVLLGADVEATGGALEALEFLAPRREPHMYAVDHF